MNNQQHPPVVSPVCFVIRASRKIPMPKSFFLSVCKTCSMNKATAYLTGNELADAILSGNLTRRLTCARCGKLGNEAEDAAIKVWSKWEDETEEKTTRLVMETIQPDKIPPRVSDMPVCDQLLEVRAGKRHINDVAGMPSAMAQLFFELGDRSIGKFLLSLKPQVRARDAIRLGLTPEMAFFQPDSWEIIFADAYYTPTDLSNLGGSFTRMLISGLPEEKIYRSAIDKPGLAAIEFNRHAFDCADWNEQTWTKFAGSSEFDLFFKKAGSKTCSFCKTNIYK